MPEANSAVNRFVDHTDPPTVPSSRASRGGLQIVTDRLGDIPPD